MDRPPQSTGFYYLNYVWFTVKLFQVSIVPLPPLPSLAYRTKCLSQVMMFIIYGKLSDNILRPKWTAVRQHKIYFSWSFLFFFEIKLARIIMAVDNGMVIVAIVVIIVFIVIYLVFRNFLTFSYIR